MSEYFSERLVGRAVVWNPVGIIQMVWLRDGEPYAMVESTSTKELTPTALHRLTMYISMPEKTVKGKL